MNNILEEAQSLVYGPRQRSYGHPRDDFARTGKFWSEILGVHVTAEHVAMCMVALKLSRAVHQFNSRYAVERDTMVDMAGYAGTLDMVQTGPGGEGDGPQEEKDPVGPPPQNMPFTASCCGTPPVPKPHTFKVDLGYRGYLGSLVTPTHLRRAADRGLNPEEEDR